MDASSDAVFPLRFKICKICKAVSCPSYPQTLVNVELPNKPGLKEGIMASPVLAEAITKEEEMLGGDGRVRRPAGGFGENAGIIRRVLQIFNIYLTNPRENRYNKYVDQ